MYLASSICVLFISLVLLIYRTPFLNATSFFLSLLPVCHAATNFASVLPFDYPAISFKKYICITIIAKLSFKFNFSIGIISSLWVMVYFNPALSSNFRWLIWCIFQQIYYHSVFYCYIIVLILIHQWYVVFLPRICIFNLVFLFHFGNYFAIKFLRLL